MVNFVPITPCLPIPAGCGFTAWVGIAPAENAMSGPILPSTFYRSRKTNTSLSPKRQSSYQATPPRIGASTHCEFYFLRFTNASTTRLTPSKPSAEGSGTVAIFVVDRPTICCPVMANALVATVSSVLANRPNLKRVFIVPPYLFLSSPFCKLLLI